MDLQYGQAKGSLTSGSTFVDAKTGHGTSTASKRYATELVYGEVISAGGTAHLNAAVAYPYVVAGTLIITDGVETFTDNGAGVMVTDLSGGSNGTIAYTTGTYDVTFTSTPSGSVTAQYTYNYEKLTTNGVPEVNFDMRQESITAIDFPLRAKFTLGSAIDLEKAHGINLESLVVKMLGEEVKFEVDHYGIEQIVAAAEGAGAATSPGTFSATVGSGQEWLFRKYELLKYIQKGSNNIFKKTLRGMASYIVAGNNVALIISQLDNHFKPAADFGKVMPTGPMLIGHLDGKPVVQDPFVNEDRFYLGWKGDDLVRAGMVVAPYIPLFSTPTLTTSDLVSQKGFLSSVGFKIINEGLFCMGAVSGV